MAVSTGVVARAFGAADSKSAGTVELDRSSGATIGSEILISFEPSEWAGLVFYDSGTGSTSGSVRLEAAMAGNHAQAQHDAAAARLIEPIRKVE